MSALCKAGRGGRACGGDTLDRAQSLPGPQNAPAGFLLAWGGSVTTTTLLSILPQPIGVGYHSVESVGSAKLAASKGKQCIMSKAREYQAKAKQCDERAKKTRCPENRDWQLIRARVYRMLAEAEGEVATRRLLVVV
jgi:hypothetical protein